MFSTANATAQLNFLFANYYSALEIAAAVVAVLILLSAIDDLFFDLWYWARRIYRKLTIERTRTPLTVEQLRERDEQPIAVMIPAWLEADVIAQMIEDMVAVLDYHRYHIFVGTYMNDEATIAEVERMRVRYKQLHRVEVPHAGPTCKADCLNWVVKAIFAAETQLNMHFAGVVLHDSEDVLHPLELKFFNYLLPRKDMIQLPVASLEREWFELVAGTYMDEFAESHAKDMMVRESVAGMVPSAGVGTCFSRKALKGLMEESGGEPFNIASLTEDYEVGTKLSQMGMQTIFARFPVKFTVRRKPWFFGDRERAVESTLEMPLAVREYFPDTFRQAYRQKARWVIGIGLQSWEQMDWKGSLASRYLLLHDRKGVVTAFISMLGYVLALQFILFSAATTFNLWDVFYPPLLAGDGWWRTVLMLNALAMLNRAAHRFYFTAELYGWRHGLMALPRMVVSNFVNFMAVARAWRLFLLYLFAGKALAWDKTMHDFPTEGMEARPRLRLGDLLKTWQAVDDATLSRALEEQRRTHLPLGTVMVTNGWLDEETLAEALAYQERLPRVSLTREMVEQYAGLLPHEVSARLRALYIGPGVDGRPDAGLARVAVASALTDEGRAELEIALGRAPFAMVARESEIAAGLRLLRGQSNAFDREQTDARVPLLGDLLIASGLLSRETFDAAMRRYRPDRHGRIGDYLVNESVISREAIEQAVSRQRELLAQGGQSA
ncbi:glycosyl transferase family protein [Herbaspirillum robiniae]|uniref:Type II secretion system protein E n=1 Tax=Herbaspirillum robiniae TaxID=2014887 RepID=A0A246WKR1_9BURK|nr:glycosyl transferase family protein [Herbaspirillum robiniae]OWY26913.1 type II secretion system protein E [Herbaspirillum robiniae]